MIGKILNNRYKVQNEIGQGGMGIVYFGYDNALEREVAIKVLTKSGLGTEGRGRLLSEAQMAAKLNHTNIITVYDVGEEDGVPFIVMEYVQGESLHEQPPESIDGTLVVMRQVCAGLQHAHDHGIIHRDLKPENVVIARDGTAKLMDFGLARSIASRYTMEGTVAGTVLYLAPEQALGQEIDNRTDLYSLGVMMYELTTGELPFVDPDPIAVISQHLHAPVVPPRAKNDEIPSTLNRLILDLMSKDPRNRPGSVGEVIKILNSIGEQEISQVEEISLLDRIVRGRLVGRERELLQARQLWQNSVSGEGQLLLISGEPGIGKTRLMHEIATEAEVSGGQVLVSECQPESSAPYAPFAQITRRALRNNGHELPDPVLAELVELSPELRLDYPDVVQNPRLDPEAEQRRLFENVVSFCNILCQDMPLMVVLEDIHWADSGSLRMLEYLARRTRQKPVMFLGTYREIELDEALPFHEALLSMTRRRLGKRVKLERLDKDSTHDLLAVIFEEQITQEFLDGIFKETEGNPFFIEEVCKALVESGEVWFEDGQWNRAPDMEEVNIPQGIRVTIQSRVKKLSQDTQEVLLTAAVIGREFNYDTLKSVTGMEEDQLIGCLEEAMNKQLIEEMRAGGEERFSFSHALIPGAILENISGLRRTRLHRRVAAAIEELHPEHYERLAYHWGEAGDEEKGLEYTIKAAEVARLAYANADAVRLYSEALDLVPGDQPERFDLLAGRAAVYSVLAEREAQLLDINAMLTLAEMQGDQGREVDALLSLAKFYRETETAKALEPVEQALNIAREIEDNGREGRALFVLGALEQALFNLYTARDYCEASVKIFEQAGLTKEMVDSLSFLSVVFGSLGDLPAANEAATRAVDLSKGIGDRLLEGVTLRRLAIAYLNQHQLSMALPYAEEALQVAQEVGDLLNEVHALNVLGIIEGRLGMFEDAETTFLNGLDIADSIGNEVGIRWILSNNSQYVYGWNLGEYTKTLGLIEDQEEKAHLDNNESLSINLLLVKVFELIRLGQYEQSLEICETLLPLRSIIGDEIYAFDLGLTALMYAELGKFDQAYHYLDKQGEICAHTQIASQNASYDFFTAQVRMIEGGADNLSTAMEKINGAITFYRELKDYPSLGDALFIKSQLHLALLGEDQSHAGLALECTSEALECYLMEVPNWVMPEQIYFNHSRALRANGMEMEADKYLRQAYERMMKVAGKIDDEELRISYLENVRDNRALREAYQERLGIQDS